MNARSRLTPPAPHQFQWLLFDLDGTLINTSELIARSIDQAFVDCFGKPPAAREQLVAQELPLEEHLRVLIRKITNGAQGSGPAGEALESAVEASFFRHYWDEFDRHIRAFDGILPMLRGLSDRRKDLALVSSKRRKVGELELERTGLSGFFPIQVFVEDVAEPKPHPDGIFRVMGLAGLRPASAQARESMIMIGDSRYDIESAQNAGVRSVCACWGWRDFDAQMRLLQDARPTYFARSPSEILRLVDGASAA